MLDKKTLHMEGFDLNIRVSRPIETALIREPHNLLRSLQALFL